MQVWLHDTTLGQAVEAELEPLTEQHVNRANATWVPEFHRRRQLRARDEDNLVWDWPSKEKYLLAKDYVQDYVVTREGDIEGIIVLQGSETSRIVPAARVVYVRYLATAPWNRPLGDHPGRYRLAGTVLLGQAVRESVAAGYPGRVGLHSLKGSDGFYRKLRFQDFGPDPAHRGMTYFELSPANAVRLLVTLTRLPPATDVGCSPPGQILKG